MRTAADNELQKINRFVGVIGPGQDVDQNTYALAKRVGYLVVQRCKAAVVCGGLGGVMRAAAEGAREARGVSIGILPEADRLRGNEHLTIALPSGVGELRDGLVVNGSDVVISVGGSWGTTVEICFALRQGKRVISLNGWKIADMSDQPLPDGPIHVSSPEHAFVVLDSLEVWGDRN